MNVTWNSGRNIYLKDKRAHSCIPKVTLSKNRTIKYPLFWSLYSSVVNTCTTYLTATDLCNGEVLCFLCGTDWMFKYYSDEICASKGQFVLQESECLTLEANIRWAEAFILMYSVTDKCSFDECNRLKFLINYNKRRRRLGSNSNKVNWTSCLLSHTGTCHDSQSSKVGTSLP
jgi:hypothetical protein